MTHTITITQTKKLGYVNFIKDKPIYLDKPHYVSKDDAIIGAYKLHKRYLDNIKRLWNTHEGVRKTYKGKWKDFKKGFFIDTIISVKEK